MKVIKKQKIAITVIACLLAASPAAAKETGKTPNSDINQEISISPARIVTPAQQEILSNAAASVLRHISDARGEIYAKNPEGAKKFLQKIDSLIQIIKDGRPVTKIIDHIWVAKKHLDYEDTEEVAADLIPIYSDLSDIEDFVPTDQARKKLKETRKSLKKGDKEAAKVELAAVAEAIIYDEVDLPLAETERQVALAREALNQNKFKDADLALQAAEDGVQFFSVSVEGPLGKAKGSFLQATKNYAAHEYDAVKAELKKAGNWIKRAEQSSDKKIRDGAASLEKSLQELKNKL